MTGFRLQVESDRLARLMGNGLAFFPAQSSVSTGHLSFDPDSITATTTDTYTVGRDWCPAFGWNSTENTWPVAVELDRAGWRDIEKQARRDKGMTGVIEYRPGDCLTFFPGGKGTEKSPTETATAKDMTLDGTTFLIDGETMERVSVWEACDDLLARLEVNEVELPSGPTCVNPTYFGRFGKVRVDKDVESEPVLDLIFQGETAPILGKVGPSFVGAIMPIDRAAYAERQPEGELSLW